ncbi:MAG: HAD family hydrolase, partial [Cyanobacteria bacterium P01_A01_bin.17]
LARSVSPVVVISAIASAVRFFGVMVLPNGINKAAGLRHLLLQMELAPNHVVGVGDAENDLDLLQFCGYGVAVANALPILKKKADFVTQGERGSGVAELIDLLLIASD